jgi:MFS family permease
VTTPSRSLLHHRDFLKLWSSQTVSMFGTQVTLLAVPLIAALVLDVSAFEFGLLGAVAFLPFILVSLPAGVWVDRLRRRPILIVGDVGRGIALLTIPIAFVFDALTIWQLYAVLFINGCLTVFFDVAYQSYLPSLVDRDQLVDGNGKLETSRSAAQIAGPGMAGVLIGVITAPFAILIDAVSLILSALFVVAIRKPEPAPEPRLTEQGRRVSMRVEIGEGLRFVGHHRYLRSITATTGWSNLFGTMGWAILVLFLVRERGFTPEMLGFAFSIGAVGFLVGAVTASPLARRLGVGRTIVGSIAVSGPALLLVAAAPPSLAFAAVAASGLLGGWGTMVYNINQVSFRQAICPERMQGRMNATIRFVVYGTIPVGSIAGGALGSLIGLHATIWVAAIGSLLAFLPVFLSPVREIREMPDTAVEEGAVAEAGAPA